MKLSDGTVSTFSPGKVIVVSKSGGGPLLRRAAAVGAEPLVEALLECGVCMFDADNDCNTALHCAAECGKAGVCRLITDRGGAGLGRIGNARGLRALDLARESAFAECVRVFDPSPADKDLKEEKAMPPLLRAASNGDVLKLRKLLSGDQGAPSTPTFGGAAAAAARRRRRQPVLKFAGVRREQHSRRRQQPTRCDAQGAPHRPADRVGVRPPGRHRSDVRGARRPPRLRQGPSRRKGWCGSAQSADDVRVHGAVDGGGGGQVDGRRHSHPVKSGRQPADQGRLDRADARVQGRPLWLGGGAARQGRQRRHQDERDRQGERRHERGDVGCAVGPPRDIEAAARQGWGLRGRGEGRWLHGFDLRGRSTVAAP